MSDAPLAGTCVLVTGACGFLGRHIVRATAGAGAVVHALTDPTRPPSPIVSGATRCAAVEACDEVGMRAAAAGCDVVVHLAGPPSVADSFARPTEFMRVHALGTAVVAEAAWRAGVRRFVYVSSAEVYGQPLTEFVGEDHRLQARSPYGAAKIGAEQLLGALATAHAHDVVVLRPFSVYGPGAHPQSLLCRILDLVVRDAAVVLHDLRPRRDYCFVSDIGAAVVRACALPHDAGVRAFNLGTMHGTSVSELAHAVLRAAGKSLPVSADGAGRPGASEILRLVADNARARDGLGWTPRVTLDEGIRMMLAARR